MDSFKVIAKHILLSLLAVLIVMVAFFLSYPYIENLLQIFAVDVTLVFMVIVCILVSYISYLLSLSDFRINKEVSKKTKWLAVSREQFRRLYENAPVPYITLNAEGEIRDPNKASLRFFGVVAEEIDSKNLFTFLPEEDLEMGKQMNQNYKSKIPINREEIRMITKSGEIRYVLLSIFDMINPADSSRTGLATIFDVTEQKNLDKAKTEFVSLASHQLRTPLATVKWYSDMLLSGQMGELREKQRDYLNRMFEVNQEMINLVSTLLNVSRIDMGTLPVEIKETNVEELCDSVLQELAPQIEKKKLNIKKEYGASLQNTKSDPKLLRIVIHNLVSNSVKYTPDGGSITIALAEKSGEEFISVADTGCGIPVAEQSSIFSKMFRAKNVRDINSAQSTGLGLYMVKSIMKTLGGDISFTSEENHGSIFTIKL